MDPDEVATAFVIHCDTNRLTMTQGLQLAERLEEAIYWAAEDRRDVLRSIAPELLDDEEEATDAE